MTKRFSVVLHNVTRVSQARCFRATGDWPCTNRMFRKQFCL